MSLLLHLFIDTIKIKQVHKCEIISGQMNRAKISLFTIIFTCNIFRNMSLQIDF